MKFILTLIILNLKIMPSLKEILNNSGSYEKIPVIVHLKEKPDYEKKEYLNSEEYVYFLKEFSENSQRDILNYLKNFSNKIEEIKTFWIFNGFYVKATKDVIEAIAKREEVEYIIEDFVIEIEKPVFENEVRTPEWNIIKVKADSCWMEGYTGQNVVIAHIGTGVDITHPALQNKWLYPYWHDAVNGQANPYDDNGHGTYTTGIILGGDGLGPFPYDIGVAPDAKFVACKCFDSKGKGFASWIHTGFQKIVEWKSQGINIVAVSNSWSLPVTTLRYDEFWSACITLRNVGIIPVFQAGDKGPLPGSVTTPGAFPFVIGVGATNINDSIAEFSGRGPGFNNILKPDFSAPGVSIKSSVPGGEYRVYSSTGSAVSHIVGGIAIIFQKNPSLNYINIYNLLAEHALKPPHGAPYPNNNYGWGILDIYRALINTPYFQSSLKISIGVFKEKFPVKFFNLCGQTINEYECLPQKNFSKIWWSPKKSGIYFVIFKTNKEIKKEKIILIK